MANDPYVCPNCGSVGYGARSVMYLRPAESYFPAGHVTEFACESCIGNVEERVKRELERFDGVAWRTEDHS